MAEKIENVKICRPHYIFLCTYSTERHLTNWELFVLDVILQFQNYDNAKFADQTLPETMQHYFDLQYSDELLNITCESLLQKEYISSRLNWNTAKVSEYKLKKKRINGVYDTEKNKQQYISIGNDGSCSYQDPQYVNECPIKDCPFYSDEKIEKKKKQVENWLIELNDDRFIKDMETEFVRMYPQWDIITKNKTAPKHPPAVCIKQIDTEDE